MKELQECVLLERWILEELQQEAPEGFLLYLWQSLKNGELEIVRTHKIKSDWLLLVRDFNDNSMFLECKGEDIPTLRLCLQKINQMGRNRLTRVRKGVGVSDKG